MNTYSVPDSYSQPLVYQVTLDQALYTATVYWNYFAQRSYLQLTDSYGNMVVNIALISSSSTVGVAPINIVAGYFFESKLYYSPRDQLIMVTP